MSHFVDILQDKLPHLLDIELFVHIYLNPKHQELTIIKVRFEGVLREQLCCHCDDCCCYQKGFVLLWAMRPFIIQRGCEGDYQ
jgi:hypothetical protein